MLVEKVIDEDIAHIILNDEKRLNAMSEDMAGEFYDIVEEIRNDDKVKIVILRGNGRAFSAGGDIKLLEKLSTLDSEAVANTMINYYKQFSSIYYLPQPTIALIHSYAYGAGFALTMFCDMRLMANNAKVSVNFTQWGLHPGMGISYTLPKAIGEQRAKYLLYTGSVINAKKALEYGMVFEIVKPEQLLKRGIEIAYEIMDKSYQANSTLKETMLDSNLFDHLVKEAYQQGRTTQTEDYKERVSALLKSIKK